MNLIPFWKKKESKAKRLNDALIINVPFRMDFRVGDMDIIMDPKTNPIKGTPGLISVANEKFPMYEPIFDCDIEKLNDFLDKLPSIFFMMTQELYTAKVRVLETHNKENLVDKRIENFLALMETLDV